MKKWTTKQKIILKKYWDKFTELQEGVYKLEEDMQDELGIAGVEFQHDEMCSGWFGIGDKWADEKDKYELWQP